MYCTKQRGKRERYSRTIQAARWVKCRCWCCFTQIMKLSRGRMNMDLDTCNPIKNLPICPIEPPLSRMMYLFVLQYMPRPFWFIASMERPMIEPSRANQNPLQNYVLQLPRYIARPIPSKIRVPCRSEVQICDVLVLPVKKRIIHSFLCFSFLCSLYSLGDRLGKIIEPIHVW